VIGSMHGGPSRSDRGVFDCGLLMGLVDAFAFLMPEFIVEEVALSEEIGVTCEALFSQEGKRK
jgi:hypothetical protein